MGQSGLSFVDVNVNFKFVRSVEVFSARQYTKNSYRDLTPFLAKIMVKSGLENVFLKFHGGLQRYLLTCQANSAFLGRFLCTGQQQL